jgi:oligosaccharide repeat unit polymerase
MFLSLLSVGVLLALSLGAKKYFGQVLHPAVMYPITWAVILASALMATALGYFDVEPDGVSIFVLGAVGFVLGGMVAQHADRHRFSQPTSSSLNYSLLALFCIAVHAVVLPFWWDELLRIGGGADIYETATSVRAKTVTLEETLSPVVGNYFELCMAVVPLLTIGLIEGKLKMGFAVCAIGPWLAAMVVSNGRSGAMALGVGMLYIHACRSKIKSWRVPLLAVAVLLATFIGGALLVRKGDVDPDSTLGTNVVAVTENFFDYSLQGPILFSRYAAGMTNITPTWDAFSSIYYLLSKVGLYDQSAIPSVHQDFEAFGSGGRVGNVYSIYLSLFPQYGLVGVLLITFLYGAWAAYHHLRFQKTGGPLHGIFAAYMFGAVFLSVFSDHFGPSGYFLLKLTFFFFVVMAIFGNKSIATVATNQV